MAERSKRERTRPKSYADFADEDFVVGKKSTATKKRVNRAKTKPPAPSSASASASASELSSLLWPDFANSIMAYWPNVFAQCMVLVSMLPPPSQEAAASHAYMMRVEHASAEFWQTFKFDAKKVVLMNDLFGAATGSDSVARIEACVLNGRQHVEFINLYNAQKKPLTCHVSAYTIRGPRDTPAAEAAEAAAAAAAVLVSVGSSSVSTAASGLDCYNWDGTVTDPASRDAHRRYAVLTIRCSSVVGHAKASGLGLLGPGRVTEEAKREYMRRLEA